MSIYEQGLGQRPANYTPLSPLSLFRRTAAVYPDRLAIRYGYQQRTWGEMALRVAAFAERLVSLGIGRDDTVAVLSPNTPAALELAFSVPGAGAVLNMINTRLDAPAVAFILDHREARVFIVDAELSPVAKAALALATVRPLVIDIEDPAAAGAPRLGDHTYEGLIAAGDSSFELRLPDNE